MTLRRACLLSSLLCAWAVTIPAAEQYLPVDAIRPGMVGVGRTVFEGTTPGEFQVRILGVLRSTVAPQRDLILARLEGGPLARTGVIAGMSGSPVYVDGRLIGAVSYALGSFPTEPIAGITPIAEMLDASRLQEPRRAGTPIAVPPILTREAWRAAAHVLTHGRDAAGPPAWDTGGLAPSVLGPQSAAALRPIAMPLALSGIAVDAAGALIDPLSRAGFIATTAGSLPAQAAASSAPVDGAGLRPGDPVGVTLLSGDYTVAASGTVTEVVGNQVYAFGHPFYGLGPIQFPMTRAVVHAVLPSLMSSTKIASTGAVIGTFSQDRATVLAGQLGKAPRTIPVTIRLESGNGQPRVVRLAMIQDAFFSPLLGFVAVGGTLSAFERDLGISTYSVRGSIAVRGHDRVVLDDVYSGEAAASEAASAVALPLAALLTNASADIDIDEVTLTIGARERADTSSIERVWLDAAEVRPGRTVPLKVLVRAFRGADDVRTVQIAVPAHVEGPLTVFVSDGPRLVQQEQRDGQIATTPSSVAQLIQQLNRVRRNNCLYVRVYARHAGAMVGGEPLPSLPSSVLAVFESDRSGSGSTALGTVAVGSWDLPLDRAVTGSRTLTITPVR